MNLTADDLKKCLNECISEIVFIKAPHIEHIINARQHILIILSSAFILF